MHYLRDKNNPDLNGRLNFNDQMYQGNVAHCIHAGQDALRNIEETLHIAKTDFRNLRSTLDFSSGYGRVLRFLTTKINSSQITASDILPQ
jgi:hypothetical protein